MVSCWLTGNSLRLLRHRCRRGLWSVTLSPNCPCRVAQLPHVAQTSFSQPICRPNVFRPYVLSPKRLHTKYSRSDRSTIFVHTCGMSLRDPWIVLVFVCRIVTGNNKHGRCVVRLAWRTLKWDFCNLQLQLLQCLLHLRIDIFKTIQFSISAAGLPDIVTYHSNQTNKTRPNDSQKSTYSIRPNKRLFILSSKTLKVFFFISPSNITVIFDRKRIYPSVLNQIET